MLFEDITILDENFDIKKHKYVGIIDDRIDYIGNDKPVDIKRFGRKYAGQNRILVPGFYNIHGHSPMSIMRGYGENLELYKWLKEKIFPFEDNLKGNDIFFSTLLSIAESLKFGIVSTTDMYFHINDMAKAYESTGAKVNLGRAVVKRGNNIDNNDTIKEMKSSICEHHGRSKGKIMVDASIHGEYTSDIETVMRVNEIAKNENVGVHIHLSETDIETSECISRHQKTPTEYFNDLGVFDNRVTAAHSIWLTNRDINILQAKGVYVASCPTSNLKLSSGICNIPKLYANGVSVGIGTDGSASNNNLNFINEIKLFALLGKYKDSPKAMKPKDVIKSATRIGALSQGRTDCGIIKEGYKADLVVIDSNTPNMYPVYDELVNLIFSLSDADIEMTIIDGKVLYDKGEYNTIDIEKVYFEVEKSKNRILEIL